MCLSKLDPKIRKPRFGWKCARPVGHGRFDPPCCGGATLQLGHETADYNDYMIKIDDRIEYHTGFHVWARKADAIADAASREAVLKCRLGKVVASGLNLICGTQTKAPCLVVRSLTPVEVVKMPEE